MRDNALNVRLYSCAGLVRQDAVFADIGTDHAYLPIFLLKEGVISRAVCADINAGPLASAKENLLATGLIDRVELVLTDGAAELSDRGITDYAICGMGGELIADIISCAPHLKDPTLNLILQPMTKQEHLRSYLYSEGFVIDKESYSLDGERSYVCFAARYTSLSRTLSATEAVIGAENSDIVNKDLQIIYLQKKIKSLKKAISGKRISGGDPAPEEMLVREIESYLSDI